MFTLLQPGYCKIIFTVNLANFVLLNTPAGAKQRINQLSVDYKYHLYFT